MPPPSTADHFKAKHIQWSISRDGDYLINDAIEDTLGVNDPSNYVEIMNAIRRLFSGKYETWNDKYSFGNVTVVKFDLRFKNGEIQKGFMFATSQRGSINIWNSHCR